MERNNNDFYFSELKTYSEKLIKDRLRKAGVDNIDVEPLYVIYARRSTKGKKHQERSLKDQINACQKLASDLNLKVVKTFKEQESAKKPNKRSVFSEMLKDIKRHRYNSIITWLPDRLSRNMKEAGEIIDLLERNTIIDLKFPGYIFNKDANGIMSLGIQFVISEQYSNTLSATSSRGSNNIAKEGRSPTKRPKFGYKMSKDGYFRPDDNNFILLRKAVDMALDKISLDEIAKHLNTEQFTFRNKLTKMTKQKLSGTFQDPFYAGMYVYGKEIVNIKKQDSDFTPLMTPEEFLRLRRYYDDANGFKKKHKRDLLFHGMVYCSYCDNLMSPNAPGNDKGQPSYFYLTCVNNKCDRYLHKNKNIKKSVRGKVIFNFIINLIKSGFQIDKEAYQEYVEQAKVDLKEERTRLMEQRKQCDIENERNENDITSASNVLAQSKRDRVKDEFDKKMDELLDNKDKIKARKEKLSQDVMDIDDGIRQATVSLDTFLNFFKNIDILLQNSNNRLLVDKIIRMVFLNFTIDDEKVLSYQVNPHFEKYLKLPSVLNSRSGRT